MPSVQSSSMGIFSFQVINQDSDKEFVKISIKVPGLKVKRQMNLQKTPKNGRVIHVEYKKK